MTALEARGLTVTRAGRVVVDEVSIGFARGTWTALVGPNGAGKSTLLQALAGLLSSARGEVRLEDRRLADWPARARARHLAWMPQGAHAQGELAVQDVVALGRLPHHGLFGVPDAADGQAVQEALVLTDAETLARRPLSALSGGERQRVLLARAFAVRAPMLLLDEPTAHLDAPHVRRLVQHLRARTAAGDTVVTVLHDLTLALQADRVLVLREGRLQADGVPGEGALHRAIEAAFDHAVCVRALGPAAHPDIGSDPDPKVDAPASPPRWVALLEQSPP